MQQKLSLFELKKLREQHVAAEGLTRQHSSTVDLSGLRHTTSSQSILPPKGAQLMPVQSKKSNKHTEHYSPVS